MVARVLAGICERHAEEGLCEAIALCADLLAERFPRGASDVDELPNAPHG